MRLHLSACLAHLARRVRARSAWASVLAILLTVGVLQVIAVAAPTLSPPAQAAGITTGTGGEFVASVGRLMDTSNGVGGYSTPMVPNEWRSLQVGGRFGVPTLGVAAAQITLTAVDPTASGLIRVAADGTTSGLTALIYGSGSDTGNASNTAIVPVAANGKITIQATVAVRLVVDVQGYYTAGNPAAGGYVPVSPIRIVDTRFGTGLPQQKLAAGAGVTINVATLGHIPADASAVFLNFTVLNYSAADNGSLTPYAADQAVPGISLNYQGSATTAIGSVVPLPVGGSTAGKINVKVNGTAGALIDLLVDVVGYFTPATGSGAFTPAATRVISNLTVAGNTTVTKMLAGVAGIPAAGSGIIALALNVQAVHAGTNGGNLHVSPDDRGTGLSLLNYADNATRSNFATVALGGDGGMNIQNNGPDSVRVYIDVQGWYTSLADEVVVGGQAATQRAVGLQARPTPSAPSTPVTYQYRAGSAGAFSPVPLGDLSDADGNPPGAWPLTPTGSGSSTAFTAYSWDIAHTLNAVTAGAGSQNTLVQVEACFGTSLSDPNLVCSMPSNVSYIPGQFAAANATTDVGPGTVALATGDFQVSANDAAAASSLGGLSIGRTATTLSPFTSTTGAPGTGVNLDPAGVFGTGWRADLAGSDAGEGDLVVTDQHLNGYLSFASPDGWVGLYQATSPITGYPITFTGVADAATDGSTVRMVNATTITMADADGTVTTWKLQGSPAVWQSVSVVEPGSNTSTTYTYATDSAKRGLVTRITAPAPAGVACSSTPDTTPGCRSLILGYGTPDGAPTGTQRLTSVSVSIPSASGGSQITQVAAYSYDSAARLIGAWDPRAAVASLKTTYGYVGSTTATGVTLGRLASITSPGTAAWQVNYDANGRVSTLTQDVPVGNPISGVTTRAAATTLAYDVPTSGNGLPSLTQTNAAMWGEASDLPVNGSATAVFLPDHVPTSSPDSTDWPYATIHYLDINGREVNTATHGTGVDPAIGGIGSDSGWIVDTTQYDSNGNQVWSLDGGARAEALAPSADTDTAVAALSTPVERAALLRTDTVYSTLDPSLVTDTYGPTHQVALTSGAMVDARSHTHTDYDEGAPNSGINPVTRAAYRLATTTTIRPWNIANSADAGAAGTSDMSITRQGYDAVGSMSSLTAIPVPNPQTGEPTSVPVTGWALGAATTSTVQIGATPSSTNDLVTTTVYDGDGRAIETRLPGDANGTTPRTTRVSYFTATGTGACVSAVNAGLVCQSAPAAQPASGAALATTTTAYNIYGDPTTVIQTYGSGGGAPVRTTTTAYDTAERATGITITLAGVAGSKTVSDVTQAYDPANGLPTTTSTGSGASLSTLATTYNSVGDVASYTDATGAITYTGYDIAGRVASTVDAKGATTWDYDNATATGEHRGLLTIERHASYPTSTDTLGSTGATTSAGALDLTAGTSASTVFGFTVTHDAAGSNAKVTYPNGMSAWTHSDSAGNPTRLTYGTGTSIDGTGAAASSLAAFTATVGGLDQTIGQTSSINTVPQSRQVYSYDGASRLTGVDDTLYTGTGGTTASCTRRTYTFDSHSNRTSLATSAPATACSSAGGSTVSSTFDQGDRITTVGYAYDSIGRTLTVPTIDATGTGTHSTATGAVTVDYFDNDMVAKLSQGSGADTQVQDFTLDPVGNRIASQTTTTGATGSQTVAAQVNHYAGGSDSPAWTSTTTTPASGTATTTWSANVVGPDGNVAAILTGTGTGVDGSDVKLQIVNLHGDICGTLPATGTPEAINDYTETTEYGIDRTPSAAKAPYGWVGGRQRSSDALAGLTLMGVRLYNPATGRFLSVDPILGGNPNAYTYPVDPINEYDLDGRLSCGWCHSVVHHVVSNVAHNWKSYVSYGAVGACILASAGVCAGATVAALAVSAGSNAWDAHKGRKSWGAAAGSFSADVALSAVPAFRAYRPLHSIRSVGASTTFRVALKTTSTTRKIVTATGAATTSYKTYRGW